MTHKLRWIVTGGGLLAVLAPAPAQAVQFGNPSFVDQLNAPTSFAYGDLDRDGRLDVASASSDGVRVRLNTTPPGSGTTSYGPPIVIDIAPGTAGRPNAVAIAELDGDRGANVGDNRGGPELVAVNAAPPAVPPSEAPTVSVLRNKSLPGDLAFACGDSDYSCLGGPYDLDEQYDAGTRGADRLAVGQLNDDGRLDILYANTETGRVAALRNTTTQIGGHPSTDRTDFAAPVALQTSAGSAGAPEDLAIGQINREGPLDVVVGNRGGTVSIFRNNPVAPTAGLSFSERDSASTGLALLEGVAIGPIDGDAHNDIAAVGRGVPTDGDGFRILRNDATRDNAMMTFAGTAGRAHHLTDVAISNLDEDTDFDLIGSREDGRAVAAANNGSLQFVVTTHAAADDGNGIFAGDVNGDGDQDVSVLDRDDSRAAIALQSPDVKTSPNLVEYVEDLPPVLVDPNLTVLVPGGTTELQRATVQVKTGHSADVLEMPRRDDISSSYDAGSRTLHLSGRAPVAAYEQALRSVLFSSPGDDPTGGDRVFAFTVSSEISSPEALRNGKVTPINDAPTAAPSGPSTFLDPARGPEAVDPGIDVRDPDSGTLAKAVLAIVRGYDRPLDRLQLTTNDPNFRSTFNSENGTLEVTTASGASLAAWRDALRSVTFDTIGTSIEARDIAITLTDGAGLPGPAATRTFAFAPVLRVAPSLSGSAVVGQILTANPGQWFGSAPIGFRYQWQRCDANGNACGDIGGATGQSYLVSPADGGHRLRAVVVADNAAPGESTAVTPPSAVVPAVGVLGARQSSVVKRATANRFRVTARVLRDGRIRLTMRSPRAGRVAISRVRVGRSTRLSARTLRIRRAGISRLTLRPTRAARRLVSRRGRLAMRLRVTYRPTRGTVERKTLKVTVKKQRAKRRSGR